LVSICFIDLPLNHPWIILAFAVFGSGMLGAFGIIAGLWAEKFDQMAAFQNFVIMPLSFLSGVFYSIHSLPPVWQTVSHFNPFFYMIDGFRYGFFGMSDISPWFSLSVVIASFIALSLVTIGMLRAGYKLRG
jgi:ABC-2 type transport system permease protein